MRWEAGRPTAGQQRIGGQQAGEGGHQLKDQVAAVWPTEEVVKAVAVTGLGGGRRPPGLSPVHLGRSWQEFNHIFDVLQQDLTGGPVKRRTILELMAAVAGRLT